jgi:RNA polymerase sigma-70 factor, ECF subfamily
MDQLEALLKRCRAGDDVAIEELIRRWERKLFYYARRLVFSEADAWDVLQQTWVRVMKGINGVKNPEKLVPWLYRVTRNTAISHRASLLARERWVDHTACIEDRSTAEAEQVQWTAEDVHWGLEAITVHHRDALTLFFLDDLSIKEIAGVLNVSEGTVKSRLHYGKKALKETLVKMRSQS